MKLKVVVVDLELTRAQKRIGVAGSAFAVALAASAAWAEVPNTFVAGQTLKAEELNVNFTALDARLGTVEASAAGLSTDADVLETRVTAVETEQTDLDARVTTLEGAPSPLTAVDSFLVPDGAPGKTECMTNTGGFPQGACARMAKSYCISAGYIGGWLTGDLAPPPTYTDPEVRCIK